MICRACGRRIGPWLEMVTYLGAPADGVPVHRYCLLRFFDLLDARELPTAPGADGGKKYRSAGQEITMTDMTKYGSASYLGVDDVRKGSIRGVIAAVEVNTKIDRPTLVFTNGLKFTLNKTNAQTLLNDVGTDDESWCGETVELTLGQVEYKEKMVDTVILSVIPRKPGAEKIKPPKPPKKKNDSGMDDAIPFNVGGEG
jgi:hypothetical protein